MLQNVFMRVKDTWNLSHTDVKRRYYMKFKFIKMLEANTDTSNTENQTTEKAFTQEDVNKMIQDRITREQAKWEKKVQDERTEAEKLAKMKADEKLKYQQEKREKKLADRDRKSVV